MHIAILIDGGYFLKHLPSVRRDVNPHEVESVVKSIRQLVRNHLERLNNERLKSKDIQHPENPYNLLHRCFYYDGMPYAGKMHKPISGEAIDFSKTAVSLFRQSLFAALKKERNFALRLGRVREKSSNWRLKPASLDRLLHREVSFDELTDHDFAMDFQQKGVDMRIGLDIAHMALTKQIDTIILVAGDSDFVPVTKFARREGVKVILDPLWGRVSDDLFEHIDSLASGFSNPNIQRYDYEPQVF